ncbi:WYL domain-containing protein [Mobilitalea sibirica]|uniref:WYL domain-containing protein n=1 Tax=Mobilitalea sibirica TaxID=1462919 RepID=A0A8J7L3A9_9FIRM|nr:WYL domain-containing protein [Mobilitalea sibirica]MBH1942173.1 WYL domain-containing protein [Mobilitalea sibirica]
MKIQRLLIILFYLSSHDMVKIDELCRLLEISKRTAYRDLEMLRTAGVEIDSFVGMKGGIRLSKNFNMDQLLLDKKEWRTLIFNSLCMGKFGQAKFSSEARELYRKLSTLFPEISYSNETQPRILIDMSYKFQGNELLQKLNCFEESIEKGHLIHIEYESPFCEHLSTDGYVAPYGLVNKVGYWYLVGYCYIHNIFRAYNLAYIKKDQITNLSFIRDPAFCLEDFWEKSNPR